MVLVIAGSFLATLTGLPRLARRRRVLAWFVIILAMAAALFPLVDGPLTGDVSRYLPAGTFSEDRHGKDPIVLASAAPTNLFSLVLAGVAWSMAVAVLRRYERGSLASLENRYFVTRLLSRGRIMQLISSSEGVRFL